MYRNTNFYLKMLKGKTMDWAYRYITENLKRPSFVYEDKNAYIAYKQVFGVEFASPEEMRAVSDRERIAKLEAELERVNAEKRKAFIGQSEIEPNPDGFEETIVTSAIGRDANSVVATKDDFLATNPGLKGLPAHRAWIKFAKENGIKIEK